MIHCGDNICTNHHKGSFTSSNSVQDDGGYEEKRPIIRLTKPHFSAIVCSYLEVGLCAEISQFCL